jgi:DnaJ-class molecular chaperone
MSDNFYNVLGVDENATKDDLKKAYRSMQMKWHPDKNNGSPESVNMTQKINEAYETLGDDQKKEEYDHIRKNPNPFMRMNGGGGMEVPMDDILNMFFGSMPSFPGMGFPGQHINFPGQPGPNIRIFHGGPMGFQQAIQKPQPIIKQIDISMLQVLSGANIPVEIERWIMENGIKVFENETIYVTIPQGIDDGEMIVLSDKGNVTNQNIKGDIKLSIKITNETEFKRSGLDLILEKNISLKESLCGFSFEINYINGKSYTLNNNKGNLIPPGYKKIYPNMGLTRGEHKGSMIIHFNLQFPEKLTDEQIKGIEAIL